MIFSTPVPTLEPAAAPAQPSSVVHSRASGRWMARMLCLIGLCLVTLGFFAPASAQSKTVVVSNDTELRQAIKAGALDVALAPGRYGPLTLNGPDLPRVLRSRDENDPAVITGLRLSGARTLTLEGLVFQYDYRAEDRLNVAPFDIKNAQDLVIRNSHFKGDQARDRNSVDDGFGFGSGLKLSQSTRVLIEGNRFEDWHRAGIFWQNSGLTIRHNDVTAIRMDGFVFAQVENVVIEQNHIHNFNRSPTSKDHSDMIQFWTNRTEWASRNITIKGNLLNSENGLYTQSIFMRNDQVDQGLKGRDFFYRNVLIEDNIIINAHLHGISLGETDQAVVRNNTVVQNPGSAGADPGRKLWVPMIRVSPASENVRITGNLSYQIVGFEGQKTWAVGNNVAVQNRSILQPGHYKDVFVGGLKGNPALPHTFRLLPNSEPARLRLGAPALRE